MQNINVRNWSQGKKLFWGVVAILMIALLVTSCASSNKSDMGSTSQAAPAAPPQGENMSYNQDKLMGGAPQPQPSEAEAQDGFGSNVNVNFSESVSKDSLLSQRKMIMDGDVFLETLNFDASIQAMDRLIESVGGFAEVRTVRGKSNQSRALRSANYVIRIPAETFEAVLEDMGSIGSVLESNSKGTDITDQYTDSQTRVKTLKVQEQTLLEILAKSTKLEDVITLEKRMSEVRYEIESIENTLKNYDRLVALSRITIYIQEVDDVTETRPIAKTLDQRISSSFTQSIEEFRMGIEDFLVWFVGSWITLIFLVIIILILIIWRNIRKRKRLAIKAKISEVKTENKE